MIKTEEQIQKIRTAGKILGSVAKRLLSAVEVGRTLFELDQSAEKWIKEAGASPAFLGYFPYGASRPFPASICASLNQVVVHGVPTKRKIKNGDLVKIDLGVNYDGYIADAAFSIIAGVGPEIAERLVRVTKQALLVGIQECRSGRALGDIGWAINDYVSRQGFKIVKGLTGHGVGLGLHEDPPIFNEGKRHEGLKLKPGMVLALEPMVSAGSPEIVQLADDSYATSDGSLSAHFEHTVLITKGDPEILTL